MIWKNNRKEDEILLIYNRSKKINKGDHLLCTIVYNILTNLGLEKLKK